MLRMREITRVIPTMLFARHAFRAAPTICKLSTSIQLSTASTSYLPPAPLPPPKEIVLNSLGEPTLASLGLNSYWPSGWYQSLLEALHVHLELPWWVAITTTTVIIRLCLFPLMVRQRRNLAKFTDAMPQFTILQERLTHARLSGNYIEVMRTSQEMQKFMSTNNLNPLQSFKYIFVQVPIFLSVFTGIRGLVNLPVESMQTGGIGWFTDLTIADPYYILPIMSMTTLLVTFESAAEMPSPNVQPIVRVIMRGVPVIGFFFVMNMPSALVWYWTVSNILAFIQTLVLRQPAVRSFLNIPVPRTPPVLQKKRGFLDGFKESMNNSRLITEMETRERVNAKTWQKAGLKGAPTTYMSDPTKSTSQPKTVSAPGRIIDVQLDTKKKAVGR